MRAFASYSYSLSYFLFLRFFVAIYYYYVIASLFASKNVKIDYVYTTKMENLCLRQNYIDY
jgi:hypothetical protein